MRSGAPSWKQRTTETHACDHPGYTCLSLLGLSLVCLPAASQCHQLANRVHTPTHSQACLVLRWEKNTVTFFGRQANCAKFNAIGMHAGQRHACVHVGTNGIADGRDRTVSPHVVFSRSHNSEARGCIYQHRLLLLSPGKPCHYSLSWRRRQ